MFGPNRSAARLEIEQDFRQALHGASRDSDGARSRRAFARRRRSRSSMSGPTWKSSSKPTGWRPEKASSSRPTAKMPSAVVAEWYANERDPRRRQRHRTRGADARPRGLGLRDLPTVARWCRSPRRATTSEPATAIPARTPAGWARILRRRVSPAISSTSFASASSARYCAGCVRTVRNTSAFSIAA